MTLSSSLYAGTVVHRRVHPREHRLRYRVFSLLIDLDELAELDRRLWLFSHNRWNLVSLFDQDFGDTAGDSLRAGVATRLEAAGIHKRPHRVWLSCYPRVFGYAFNPLNVYYCADADGQIYAVIHEVNNTFGERHAYVMRADVRSDNAGLHWIDQSANKRLFVSPFNPMNMRYRFRLNVPDERQVIIIRVLDSQGLVLTASYSANRQALTARHLLRRVLAMPLMTVKVITGIHFEALRLWLKRVPWYPHQAKRNIV